MTLRRRRSLAPVPSAVLAAAAAAAVALGCGAEELPPVPSSCTAEPDTIVASLAAAPRPVALSDGATISACVANAQDEAELQNVGVAFSRAAEDLELPALDGDAEAALRLGYLVGAARKGAQRSSGGVSLELVRRLERSAALDGSVDRDVAAALQRGLAAGASGG